MRLTGLVIAILLFATLPACASDKDAPNLGFIALGDAGLHHDWYDPDDIGYTYEELVAEERADWIEDGRPPEDFVLPPLYQVPGTDYVVEQSGQAATATAIEQFCNSALCEFMIVLGDNIYPDGADGSGSESDHKMLWD